MKFFSIDNIITSFIIITILVYFSEYFNIDFLDPIQNIIQDTDASDIVFSKIRDKEKVPYDTNIIIVNIGEYNRAEIADEIEIINKYHPKVVGIDAFFLEPKTEELDIPLINAIFKIKNLVLVSKIDSLDEKSGKYKTLIQSHSQFTAYGVCGFANFISDDEQLFRTVKKFSPKEYVNDSIQYAFAVVVSNIYNPKSTQKFLKRNNETEIINYKRFLNKYRVLDVNDIIEKQDSLGFIHNKIVLLGYLGPNIKTITNRDAFFTPMNDHYIGRTFPDMYGVLIHANIISMILEEDYINAMPTWLNNLLTFIICYFTMALFSYMRVKLKSLYEIFSILIIVFQLVFILFICLFLLHLFNFWMELKAVLFVLIIAEIVSESYHGSIKPIVIDAYNKFIRKTK